MSREIREREPAPRLAETSASPRRRGRRALVVIGAVAVVAAGFGILSRVRARTALSEETRRSAAPTVSVIQPKQGSAAQELVLPGNVQAHIDAPIYARTNGYVKKWYFDIGARVRKGQRLADIDSPEIEQQLQQARAELAATESNARLAKLTAGRFSELAKSDSASRQEADNAAGAMAAQNSAVDSARANVRRLEQLVSFGKIDAPFDGVITARNTDIGQLVDAGSGGGPARELFHVADTSTLRVFVNVPQVHSGSATPGLPVELTFAEKPGRRFLGKIVRTANAIDPATRTLLVEIDLDNSKGEILPGTFAGVHLKLASQATTVLLPVSALMFRAEGVRVAALVRGNHAAIVPVTIGRDFGTTVEIIAGLSPGTLVIDSPPDSLVDGQEVRVAERAPTRR